MLKGAFRHARMLSITRGLNDSSTAAMLNCPHARCAVIKRAAEDYADNAVFIDVSGGPKESIDGWTLPILARPSTDEQTIACDDEMMVGRRDVDLPPLHRF